MSSSETNELARLDEVLTELRTNARAMATDLVEGVRMTRWASRSMFYVAMLGLGFAVVYLVTIPLIRGGNCCYTIMYSDLAGGLASIALLVLALRQWRKLRSKYEVLRVRYDKLLEIESALKE